MKFKNIKPNLTYIYYYPKLDELVTVQREDTDNGYAVLVSYAHGREEIVFSKRGTVVYYLLHILSDDQELRTRYRNLHYVAEL